MGQLSRDTIISEGLLMAGDTRLSDRMVVHLNAWLRSQYMGHTWPFLLRSKPALPLPTGQNTFTLGVGSTETLEIRRIISPVVIYDSAKTLFRKVPLYTVETDASSHVASRDSAKARGIPTECRVDADTSTYGRWNVTFNMWADRDLVVEMKYYYIPADLSAGAAKPIYPNDRTLLKVVEVEALRYKKADNYQQEMEVLASMVLDDKLKAGDFHGSPDWLDLDSSVFRK